MKTNMIAPEKMNELTYFAFLESKSKNKDIIFIMNYYYENNKQKIDSLKEKYQELYNQYQENGSEGYYLDFLIKDYYRELDLIEMMANDSTELH